MTWNELKDNGQNETKQIKNKYAKSKMTDYELFLETKKHSIGNFGFEPTYIPDMAFDFQQAIIEKAVRKGRIAIYADTGLGKTLIQLSIAKNIVEHTNKNVLILTPLAVAFQFIIEAEKLGIDDIEYSKDGKFTKKIVICNYERNANQHNTKSHQLVDHIHKTDSLHLTYRVTYFCSELVADDRN